MTSSLTPRQRAALLAVHEHVTSNAGAPPTYEWLGRRLGINTKNGVLSLLKPLKKKGYLDWVPNAKRGLRVLGLEVRLLYTDDEAGRRLRAALEGAE
jgi:SOS-response transcriptional repressor LexA